MAEWFKAAVLKTVGRKSRGFESYLHRHLVKATFGSPSAKARQLILGAKLNFLSLFREAECQLRVFRIFVEFFREPDAHLGFIAAGITMGQMLSSLMIVAGLALFLVRRKQAA